MTKEMQMVFDYEKMQARTLINVSDKLGVGYDIKCGDRALLRQTKEI